MKSSKQVRSPKSRSSRNAAQTRREAGAAAVEFMLVLPILLALIFGMINFGFIFAAQISLNSSARDAARAGVVKPLGGSPQNCSVIASSARDGAVTIGVARTSINVTVTGPAGTCSSDSTSYNGPMCNATNGQLVVLLKYTAESPAPLVPPRSAILWATGAFQCEY